MPLLWLSTAFMLGILLAAGCSWPVSAWMWLAGLGIVIATLLLILRRFLQNTASGIFRYVFLIPYPLIPLSIALGGLRYQSAQPDLSDPGWIARYSGQGTDFVVEGILAAPPDRRDQSTYLRLETERIRAADSHAFIPVHGLLLAQVPSQGEWRYGDRMSLQGKLVKPPEAEEFSYRETLARQGIYGTMPYARAVLVASGQGNRVLSLIYGFKERALNTVYRLYPDPEASLLAGILLGVDAGIPIEVQEAFKATGTAHIIAISGFNMSIVAGLFVAVFGRLLGRWKGALAALLGIAAYTLLVGASASVVRAALMGGLALFARQVGRRQQALNSLALVAALMALFTPLVLWDVGFQLSFAATLGLILYAEPLSTAFTRWISNLRLPAPAVQRLSGWVGEFFLFTLAAQLMTLPVMLYHFGRLSLTALVANPLVLPVQPAVMILSGLAVLLGMVWLPLGQLVAYLAWPFGAFTIRAVELLGSIRAGELVLGPVSLLVVVLFYAALLAWTFAAQRVRKVASTVSPSLALAGLFVLAVLVWQQALAAPDGRLHLTVLNVGNGEALLVQTPAGRSLLIGGGSSLSALSQALGRRLPLGQRRLDWLVLPSVENESISALPMVLERFPADQVLWAGPANTRSALALEKIFSGSQITPVAAQKGQVLNLGGEVVLRVIEQGESGESLMLEWDSFHALLPVGLDADSLKRLQSDSNLRPVDALLLADGGSAELNPTAWISKMAPQVALLSVAAGDRGGGPDQETLAALQGYTVMRTDMNGWIQLSTDGERMWVEVERR